MHPVIVKTYTQTPTMDTPASPSKRASSESSLGSASDTQQLRVAVIGTGAIAHALCSRARQQAATNSADGNAIVEFVVGAKPSARFDIKGVPVLSVSEAVKGATAVVLSIPCSAHAGEKE
jgi:hypothetical protein